MEFKNPNKEIRWFWKTQLNGNKTQNKTEPEEKVIVLNNGKNKYNKNGKLFNGKCNKCGKYGPRASYFWGNMTKGNENVNNNNNNRKIRFNRK